jgi:Copper type II ascorbate-dependent monooxygenase, C-terminal domain
MRFANTLLLAALASLVACGSDAKPGVGGDDQPAIDGAPGTDGANGSDAGADPFVAPAGFTRLLGGTWSLAAGETDTYKCVRFTVPEDTYATSILAEAPTGTHHTVLSIAGPNGTGGADGPFNCSVGTLGTVMLFASGVNTNQLDFPTDVGVKIPAGTQILLNLHLFNASDNPVSGESAIWIKKPSAPPPMIAEMAFAGKFIFSIPADNQDHSVTGGCTTSSDFTLFALWPHMHMTGKHAKFEVTHAGTKTMYLDEPYSFTEQQYWPESPLIQIHSGDTIAATCTWNNNTGTALHFGESSTDEMCFIGMYRYPAVGSSIFACTDMPGGHL